MTMTPYAWERIEKGKTHKEPRAWLVWTSDHAYIRLNAGCRPYFDHCPFALLFFDANRQAVGIQPVSTKERGAYKVSHGNGQQSLCISAQSMVEHYGLTGPFEQALAEWDQETHKLVFRLVPAKGGG